MKKTLTLHKMTSFGGLPSEVERIRIDTLEKRLLPKVPFPHKHDFFQIVVVEQGKGWHEIDFQRHSISPDLIFILKPGQVHSWDFAPDSSGYLIEFESNAIQNFPAQDSLASRMHSLPDVLGYEPQIELVRLCRGMMKEQKEKEPEWQNLLFLKLMTMIFRLLRISSPITKTQDQDPMQIFMRLVELHYGQHHNIEFYAKEMRLTPKALTMRLTRAHAMTPKKIIQERSLLEAKRMLAYSSKSNIEIADEIGFDDPNYFVRLFKAKTGMTPNEFRKSQKTRDSSSISAKE